MNELANVGEYISARRNPKTEEMKEWRLQIHAFSDSVYMTMPVESDTLSIFLFKLRFIYDRMLEMNCWLRGAVTMGDVYRSENKPSLADPATNKTDPMLITENASSAYDSYTRGGNIGARIALGPALIEAYEMENKAAIYPRIIFSEKLYQHIKTISYTAITVPNHCMPPGSSKASPICSNFIEDNNITIKDFIRTDFDGMPHFDLLHRKIYRNDTLRIVNEKTEHGHWIIRREHDLIRYDQWMSSLREKIIERLNKEKDSKPEIKAKFLWYAQYFNKSIFALPIERIPIHGE